MTNKGTKLFEEIPQLEDAPFGSTKHRSLTNWSFNVSKCYFWFCCFGLLGIPFLTFYLSSEPAFFLNFESRINGVLMSPAGLSHQELAWAGWSPEGRLRPLLGSLSNWKINSILYSNPSTPSVHLCPSCHVSSDSSAPSLCLDGGNPGMEEQRELYFWGVFSSKKCCGCRKVWSEDGEREAIFRLKSRDYLQPVGASNPSSESSLWQGTWLSKK